MSLLLFSPEDGSYSYTIRLPPKQTVVNHLVREGDGSNKTQQDIISSEGMQFQGMPAHLARVGSPQLLCSAGRVECPLCKVPWTEYSHYASNWSLTGWMAVSLSVMSV